MLRTRIFDVPLLLVMVAVAVLSVACGSDSDDDAAASESSSTAVETTTTVDETTTTETETTEAPEDAFDPTQLSDDELLDFVIDNTQIGVSDEERGCVRESAYIDVDGIRDGDTEAGNRLLLAMFECVPERVAELTTAGVVVEGVDAAGVLCASTEAIRVLTSLSDEEALAGLESADYPEGARPAAIAAGRDVCGLTEEQVAAVIDG